MVLLKDILYGDFIATQFLSGFSEPKALYDAHELFKSAALALKKHGLDGNEEVVPVWVPARIEILGKHTDYAGGKSLLAALSKGFAFIAHANNSNSLYVLDAKSQQQIRVNLNRTTCTTPYSWGVYVRTVVGRVQQNFGRLPHGATIAMSSNIPTASGMSSSSALITGLFLSLSTLGAIENHPEYQKNIQNSFDLADYLGHIENGQTYRGLPGERGVGTFGGSQDHTAILCSKAGKLGLFEFQPTRFIDDVSLPEGYCFVIGCSGVRAEKTKAAQKLYNRCALLVKEILACQTLNPDGKYHSLGEMTAEDGFSFADAKKALEPIKEGPDLVLRLYQFLQETYQIIPGVFKALEENDYDRMGKLIDLSQELADSHLKNQIPETRYLARTARSYGAVASSGFGAGFGGSVWALVEEKSSADFRKHWERAYLNKFPQWQKNASFFVDPTSEGANKGK